MPEGSIEAFDLGVVSWRVRSAAIQPLVVASQPSQSEAGTGRAPEGVAGRQSVAAMRLCAA